MREISSENIADIVADTVKSANYNLPQSVLDRIVEMRKTESSQIALDILDQIIQNAKIARKQNMPICQDTGFSVFFVKMGSDVKIVGETLEEAISSGVARGHIDGYLRKSIVEDPVRRNRNTGDNTPPVIWIEITPGDKLIIDYTPKGGGSENMSQVRMMKPADGEEGLCDFVMDSLIKAGGNPCPPVIIGVGTGGTFEKCAWLSKKALLRDIGERNPDPYYANLEKMLLERANSTGIGPMGLGGNTTALEVFIEQHPCHIASYPVAVNFNCHATRHRKIIL